MITSSSSLEYRHALVKLNRPEARLDYGWYAHILQDCDSDQLDIERVHLPVVSRYDTTKSVQHVFLKNYLESLP